MSGEVVGPLVFLYFCGAIVTFFICLERDIYRDDEKGIAVIFCSAVLWLFLVLRHLPRVLKETFR